MQPVRTGSGTGRIIAGAVVAGLLAGGGASAYLLLRGGNDEVSTVVDGSGTDAGGEVLSAEEGAAARASMAAHTQGGTAGAAGGLEAAGVKMAADQAMPIECGPGDGGEIYVPTAEELATANADTEALAATFDTFGVTYVRQTDPSGFAYLEWDYNDMVASSVSDSFWTNRYPVVPPSQEELDRVRADNDVIARYLDQAGVAYTRTSGPDGWESIEYDYDDPVAQQAVTDAYTELYPPVPPTAEELATVKADNDKLAAAFDAAGIAYTRRSDELGWEWLEWDYEDPDTQARVDAVYAELYPIDEVPCLADGSGGFDAGPAVAADDGAVAVDGAVAGDEIAVVPAEELTPQQVARRDAEAEALAEGFAAAGVTYRVLGESPWQTVNFDIADPAAVDVVGGVLASRG